MKGFPNQVANLAKLASGMECLVQLSDAGHDVSDDAVFGEALVRAGVAGTGHKSMPAEEYLQQQRTKPPSNQSFRTTARGLRELYGILGFINVTEEAVEVTATGRQIASYAGSSLDDMSIEYWRRVIRDMTHDGDDGEVSHPYLVLLRLIANKPGITRGKCALALEARNDLRDELDRIVALADLSEDEIRSEIGVKKWNWENAKKILPSFAEQLGDVVKTGYSFTLSNTQGQGDNGGVVAQTGFSCGTPRASRKVTSKEIARAGTLANFDEIIVSLDPEQAAATIQLRGKRLQRHQLIVQALAARLEIADAELHENPFDILALISDRGFLVEVKTLDGTSADERDRVREALGQLLYYEAFAPVARGVVVEKVACFEGPIAEAHRNWLNENEIAVIWMSNGGFVGDALATATLGVYLEELR